MQNNATYNKEYYRKNKKKILARISAWRKLHPEKRNEETRKYRLKYPEKVKRHRDQFKKAHPELKFKYSFLSKRATLGVKLSFEEYEKMILKQGNRCAICNEKEKNDRALAIDHCHKTGEVRELLCKKCNTALGNLGDDILLLKKAIFYLVKHQDGKN